MRITKDKVNGMVELSGVNIKHKSFGVGKVIEQTDTYLKIEFPVGTKQFQFPEAFEKFLQCENSNIQNKFKKDMKEIQDNDIEINFTPITYSELFGMGLPVEECETLIIITEDNEYKGE